MATHESQKQFLQDLTKCVDLQIEQKAQQAGFEVEEELYEVLRKVAKLRDFAVKYRDRAQVKLEELLQSGSMQRAAKKKDMSYSDKKVRIKGQNKELDEDELFEEDQEPEEAFGHTESIGELAKPG